MENTKEKVCNDHEPVVITHRDGQPMAMLALDDYEALASHQHKVKWGRAL